MARQTIAILGGGLGALATAYALTKPDRWWEHYRIDLYQKGWRLGGKGASGRNAREHQRIEEHGLHCFWGFYRNAFGMLKDCYLKCGEKIEDAFTRLDYVHFIEKFDGQWCHYEMDFPADDQVPWDPPTQPPTVLALGLAYLEQMAGVLGDHPDVATMFDEAISQKASEAIELVKNVWRRVAHPANEKQLMLAASPDKATAIALLAKLGHAQPKVTLRAALKALPPVNPDDEYRKYILAHALKYAFFFFKGMLEQGVPTDLQGFDDYDREDLAQWLCRHEAPAEVTSGPIVRGFYNSSFCHPHGNFHVFNLAAGVSARAVLLMGFTYRGSFMWKMNAGMGDIVMSPVYRALLARGEEADEACRPPSPSFAVHFFHKVTALRTDGRGVGAIEIDVQARTKDGKPYDPLLEIKNRMCWPNEPDLSQLENGDALRGVNFESDWEKPIYAEKRVLRRGADFDQVALAIPVGALETVAADLVAASSDWKNMVDTVQTVRTKCTQVWLRAPMGQHAYPTAKPVMTDVYQDDYNSIADMWQTIDAEDWPAGEEPTSIVYFSTPMPDDPREPPKPSPGYQAAQDADVKSDFDGWLADWNAGIFEPAATIGFFSRANVDADARYTLSVSGSTAARLAADKSGFDNLFLAGDWTHSPLNLGCAENAVMSGLACADAVARVTGASLPSGVAAYVEYPGMPVFPPPYQQKKIELTQLVLPADAGNMQALLDRLLNPAAGEHRFHVLGKWAVLQLGFIGENRGGFPDASFGTASETSATILVPCARWRGFDTKGDPPLEVGFFAPYIFVDHPLSLVAGREVVGMAKSLATFETDGGRTTVRTHGLRKLGADQPIELLPLLRLERGGAAGPPSISRGALAGDWWRWLGDRFLSGACVTFFCLRQLRDVQNPSGAAFAELTRGRMRLGAVKLAGLPSRYIVGIEDLASHPIRDSFGFSPGPLTPLGGLKIEVDEATLDVDL